MKKNIYSHALIIPAMTIFFVFFILPTLLSFFFSFTLWRLTDWEFIGFENYITFFTEDKLRIGLKNTFIYAFATSGAKVIIGLLLGVLLVSNLKTRNVVRSIIFFPHILSLMAVGITFLNLMHPSTGIINKGLALIGIAGPDWSSAQYSLLSVIVTDIWKGLGMSTVIYISGITAIPTEYTEAMRVDGGNAWHKFRYITLPLVRPSMNSVIILSFIGGLRSFDLIHVMTKGGPGFSSDVMSSIIYKQYAAGYYGLSTAGNIVLFLMVAILAFPLYYFLTKREAEL